MSPMLKIALEIGPLAAFFIVFGQLAEADDVTRLLWATGAFMAALAVSLGVTYALTKKFSRMALVTCLIVAVTGALTFWLQDGDFIKMKPSLVNGLFAGALFFGLLRGESYLKLLMGELFSMTHVGWMKLTRNWAFFFLAMAVLNEVVWRTQSTETWVDVKVFGYLPLTLLFTFSQAPLMMRHATEEQPDAAPENTQNRALSE